MDELTDYDYDLPPELIAQTPISDRSASRLMVLDKVSGHLQHLCFRDLPSLLVAGDVLVLNETRVTALRLHGKRDDSGGAVELLVLPRNEDGSHACLAKPARRCQIGVRLAFQDGLIGTVTGLGEDGLRNIVFNSQERLANVGQTPLPPYIKASLPDPGRYQTVYATSAGGGSAAAPTAGLHFTNELLELIESKGVAIARVCLDVGIDTFRPVQVDNLADHRMHGEPCSVGLETAQIIANSSGRVIAVGTTTVRTLETFARLPGSNGRLLAPGTATSKLFLRPGSEFRIVDALLTNFHLPRTTMLMMLSALAGRHNILGAYAEAVREHYRFLSFGDAMFIA